MTKNPLGRGLSALLEEPHSSVEVNLRTKPSSVEDSPKQSVSFLPIKSLVPGAFQPRKKFDELELDALAESIAQQGVLQPLLVRPKSKEFHEIVAGERRWRAAQRAGLKEVPVLVKILENSKALEIALIENVQRSDLTSLEEAEGYQRLMKEFSYTQLQLAETLGKSRSHIANMLRLLLLPEKIKRFLNSGKLSPGHARALIGRSDAESLADLIIRRNMNVRQVERLVGGSSKPFPKRTEKVDSFSEQDSDKELIEEHITQLLGLKTTLEASASGRFVKIKYDDFRQLDRFMDLLSKLNHLLPKEDRAA
ncbi:MAG: ParB/RepB/Spo0J family partition protein [bacterium]|nr:ParB/RepB/Spo0J family partition protein [bacterium]